MPLFSFICYCVHYLHDEKIGFSGKIQVLDLCHAKLILHIIRREQIKRGVNSLQTYLISSYKYGIDISEVLSNRLGAENVSKVNYSCANVTVESKEQIADAICDVLLLDIAQFELADMINELPFELSEKKRILIGAVAYSRRAALRIPVRRALFAFFSENNSLVLEGFILFRMADTVELWERCVEKAAEDVMLGDEREELLELLCSLLPENDAHILLIINPDTSITLIDEDGTHIDYPCGCEEAIMGIMLTISPAEIELFDMSEGIMDEFVVALKRAFPQKIRMRKQK